MQISEIRAAAVLTFEGAHLLRLSVRFVKRLAKVLLPARSGQNLFQQRLRRADAVAIVKGQVEALFVEQGTDVFAIDRRGDRLPLVAEFGRVL